MNKIQSSWELIKASFSVLQSDKELIIFPIVSSIGTLIVTLSFAIPMMLAGVFEYIFSDIPGANIVGFVILFLFYIFQYFIVIFSNSALVGAAMIRLKGGDPTVSDGFRIALQNFKSIFGFAIISATVGMILRMISERSNTLGRFVISLIGLAWNLATFLVIPVLVVEGVGPIESVKRSVALLKRTWGEQIAGNIGFGLFFGLLTIAILVIAIPITIFLLANEIWWLAAAIGILTIFTLSFLSLLSGALSGIFTAAVYRYAADGETGSYFPSQLVEKAFVPKP